MDAKTVEVRRRTIAEALDGIVTEEARPTAGLETTSHGPIFAVG